MYFFVYQLKYGLHSDSRCLGVSHHIEYNLLNVSRHSFRLINASVCVLSSFALVHRWHEWHSAFVQSVASPPAAYQPNCQFLGSVVEFEKRIVRWPVIVWAFSESILPSVHAWITPQQQHDSRTQWTSSCSCTRTSNSTDMKLCTRSQIVPT